MRRRLAAADKRRHRSAKAARDANEAAANCALGLIDDGRPPRIANPIYQELVPQELSHMV